MKNIMKRVSRARNFKRINFRNLDYVFKLKWSSKQIQFDKIKATQRFINNNSFFVKIKNAFIFIKRRFQSKINQFRFNPLTSPGEGFTVFTSPYLSAGAPALCEAKGLIIIDSL